MTFAVLGSIGAAIAEGATVAGTAAASLAPELAAVGTAIGDVGGGIASAVLPEAIGGGAAGAGTSAIGSGLATIGSAMLPSLGMTALQQGIGGIQNAQISAQNQQMGKQGYLQGNAEQEAQAREARSSAQKVYGMAEGGEVPLNEGDFVWPADVTSILGNGSTDAGARFLNDFFGLSDAGSRNT